MHFNRNVGRACAGLFLAVLMVACTQQETTTQSDLAVGRLDVPLQTQSAGGTLFRLAATFALSGGPETLPAQTVSQTGAAAANTTVSFNPRVGSYSLAISAWTLYQLDAATGNVAPRMDATLQSPTTQNVVISANQTTHVTYQFVVPGSGTIVFSRGNLDIDFNVNEGFADGAACMTDIDCSSKVCSFASATSTSKTCAPASCTDGVQNGIETGPDCMDPVGAIPGCPSCMAATACVDNASCPMGQQCSAATGTCYTPTSTCTPACPAGSTCVSGMCSAGGTTTCMAGSTCPDGTVCPATGTCGTSTSTCTPACAAGSTCVSGMCTAGTSMCTAATGCPAGQTCSAAGTCVTATSTCTPACTAPQVCSSGVCLTPCTFGICPAGTTCVAATNLCQ